MITAAQFRKLALAFPEVEEKSHFEQPDFRVRNKIFAGLYKDGSEGTLKLTPDLQAMVLSAEPDVFIPAAGAWGRSGWTRIVLSKAELPGLRELLAESYRLVAPKRLIASQPSLQDEPPPAANKTAKKAPPKRKSAPKRKAATRSKPAPKRKPSPTKR
jgi:hypothetical protein